MFYLKKTITGLLFGAVFSIHCISSFEINCFLSLAILTVVVRYPFFDGSMIN
jgi:hypothetical protein